MKHLISFSLTRRFKNKITIILHILILSILICVFYSDKIIDKFFSSANTVTTIYYDLNVEPYIDYFELENTEFKLKKGKSKDDISISLSDKTWYIKSEFALNQIKSAQISSLIENAVINKWLNEMTYDSANVAVNNLYPNIKEETISEVLVSTDKQNISMFLITGIYFAMLSFSTMIANEVVYEKTSRVLELVLTSVSTTTHYLSKMIIGWLTILIQILIVSLEVALIAFSRNYYDEGLGLLKMLGKYQIIQTDANTFKAFIKAMNINASLVYILFISLMYLLLGILIIQTIMVCLSSFINSIEESSVIQAPVYIVLLIIYYLALAFNAPNRLNVGLGYYLSLSPIFSMLFMPMRLLLIEVSKYEVLLGLTLNFITLALTTYYGAYIYKIGILGGFTFRNKNRANKK